MSNENPTGRSEYVAGVMNIVLGAVLFLDSVFLGIMAGLCFLLSFSLFFMAAIPTFFVVGALCFAAFVSAIVNVVTGVGSVVAAQKSGKASFVISVAAVVVDVVMIPANVVACVFGAILLHDGIGVISVLSFSVAALAVALALVSLILNIIRIMKNDAPTRQGIR